MLFPETLRDPGFDVVESVSMRSQRFTCVRLFHPYMPCLPHDFSIMLTTAAFDRSSLWLFEASTYMATSKGLPSSLVQHDAFASSGHNAGPPLQGLPPSHARPPRSTAGNMSSAGCLKTGPQYTDQRRRTQPSLRINPNLIRRRAHDLRRGLSESSELTWNRPPIARGKRAIR